MDQLTFFHAPNSRSAGTLALLEELGAEFELHLLNLKNGDQRKLDYLKINPMGKVPAILHNGALVTEQVAIFIYLADLFPKADLAPKLGDGLRGPYLRWMAFYGSCFEPAIVDRAMKRDPAPASSSPYGDFDTVFNTLNSQLAKGPFFLGEKFTALDVLWGGALSWITMFGLIPATPLIKDYIERVNKRPAMMRAKQKDAELAAAL
jgi:glutathione S-transferase